MGVGLWLLVSLVPRLRRPSLLARIAPSVFDVAPAARESFGQPSVNPLPVFSVLLGGPRARLRQLLDVAAGGRDVTALRLRQAGLPLSVEQFRSQQLVWAAVAGSVGLIATSVIGQTRPIPVLVTVAAAVLAAAGGFVARDIHLQRRAKARSARMAAELPAVLEFLTLSLSAGEGTLDAIRRVARVSRGELAAELAAVTRGVASGLPLAGTLTELARVLQLPAFTRAVEQITGALERGTPLAEVLRAQAQDTRDDAKRALLELAGKKEVAMLVPLVFLILPITILFAIFPGIFVLQMGV
ncbi:MAG: type II secretion system F family protein [Glaciihabitans sp.]